MSMNELNAENKRLRAEVEKLRWENQALHGALNYSAENSTRLTVSNHRNAEAAGMYRRFGWLMVAFFSVCAASIACTLTALYMVF